jgi:hypothetical protein
MLAKNAPRAAPVATGHDPHEIDQARRQDRIRTSTVPNTTATDAHHDRAWWHEEARRIGSDWSAVTRFSPACITCGADPCINPSFCLARQRVDEEVRQHPDAKTQSLRRLHKSSVSLERAYTELNRTPGRAAASTIEALMFGLRERGVAALNEPKVQSRLAALSDVQLLEVATRLQKLKPEIARAWNGDEIETLIRFREGQR